MKRLIALFVILLIAVMPAMAEFTPYDYHIMYTANGNYIVYDFPDVMLYIPIEWEDTITVEQTDTGLAFFQTASYDKFLADGLGWPIMMRRNTPTWICGSRSLTRRVLSGGERWCSI